MDRFIEMRAFVQVVDSGSFVRAAEALEISKAVVSRVIGELEERLGVRLLNRTTRRLSLTEDGDIFCTRCRHLLADLQEAELEVASRKGKAVGLVKIAAPVSFGILHLSEVWGQFRARHRQVTLDVVLSDRIVDLVEDGFDLAIRIARLETSSLVQRKLASTRLVMCASPQYLKRAGAPAQPSDLARHSILAYSLWSGGDDWQLDGPDGPASVRTTPCIRSNNGDVCRAGALAHQGIILQPTFLVGDDLEAGRLVEVLPAYRSVEMGIYAVYPNRKHLPVKVRLLIDFLANWFKTERWAQV